jgi:mannose-6-phosphate isomerase-like protein (cupin superfamily)/rubrerythrin
MYNQPYYFYQQPIYRSGAEYLQQDYQQAAEVLLACIKGEATDADFYSRLAELAPNDYHKNTILHAIEAKKAQLKQFTDLYTAITGLQPVYKYERVKIDSYSDGLKKAYNAGLRDGEVYHQHYLTTQLAHARNLFFRAFTEEAEHMSRFHFLRHDGRIELKDYGGNPFVVDIEEATTQNETFRTALWTGEHLQVTLMSIDVGDDIGLEVHPDTDQFLRLEQGQGLVQMGDSPDRLDFQAQVSDDFAIMVPAGKWHNITNTGNEKMKLYAIYAPPEHPFGTVHRTKAEAKAAEEQGG